MSLDPGVALLVLFSAVLHATWNALTKASTDRIVTMAGVMGTCALIGGAASVFLPAPAPGALPFLALSAVFHFGYQQFLLGAYRNGDFSLVYPIARGLSPLLIALLASAFAGEVPRPVQALGIALASAAMASFAFEPREPHPGVARSVASAFACAAMIGSYTFLDGQGVRHSGNAFSYVAWSSWATSLGFCVFALVHTRGRFAPFFATAGVRGIAGGVLATLGYGIAVWAMSRGAMASVSALRETGVVFAALIGTHLLGEGFGARRTGAALCVALGVVLLQSG